jgi:hypothetical protein
MHRRVFKKKKALGKKGLCDRRCKTAAGKDKGGKDLGYTKEGRFVSGKCVNLHLPR